MCPSRVGSSNKTDLKRKALISHYIAFRFFGGVLDTFFALVVGEEGGGVAMVCDFLSELAGGFFA
jgi:hypothetical protein